MREVGVLPGDSGDERGEGLQFFLGIVVMRGEALLCFLWILVMRGERGC